MTAMGTVIRVEYSPESLGGISAAAFEAELWDALLARWPGATVNVTQSVNDKCWGVVDETEIDSEEIRRVSESVFGKLCREAEQS